MFLIFWPITDQADVDSEEDWVCCGIMHSFFGSMLFMFGELTKFPTMLFIYNYVYEFSILPYGFFQVGLYDEYIQWIMLITVLPGIVAYSRIYMCLYSHVCATWHHQIVIISMTIYFIRTLLFTLYALIYTIIAFQLVWQGWSVDGFIHHVAAYTIWLTLTFDYACGSYMSYLSLDFMMNRYRHDFLIKENFNFKIPLKINFLYFSRGYWGNMPKAYKEDVFRLKLE
uniref:Serpentine receptor class gamma n=1 Tax=Meloidogyne hapla TaxID=6305 RepID=A0A1I8B7J2_MELHA